MGLVCVTWSVLRENVPIDIGAASIEAHVWKILFTARDIMIGNILILPCSVLIIKTLQLHFATDYIRCLICWVTGVIAFQS